MDLEKFFDRVNHDVPMERLARRIADKRLLRIVRRLLEAGIMKDGVVIERYEGTRREGRCPPCLPISCWTSWTRSWRDGATVSAGTPTTATST
jgi:hypothetical protein